MKKYKPSVHISEELCGDDFRITAIKSINTLADKLAEFSNYVDYLGGVIDGMIRHVDHPVNETESQSETLFNMKSALSKLDKNEKD